MTDRRSMSLIMRISFLGGDSADFALNPACNCAVRNAGDDTMRVSYFGDVSLCLVLLPMQKKACANSRRGCFPAFPRLGFDC